MNLPACRLRPALGLRRFSWSYLFTACLFVCSLAAATPRVGEHDGFTRLVFDLPQAAASQVSVKGQSVTVKLTISLKADQGALSAPGVTAYAVAGGTVTVTLAKGYSQAKVSVLPAGGGLPARLVIDVPGKAAANPTVTPTSTTPTTRPTSASTPERPRVVLDPGHGGIDPGMTSQWMYEKDVTLDVVLRTRAELARHGVEVVLTRAVDKHLSANKSDDLNARSRMATTGTVSAFVSVHVNAGNPAAQGIETYYFGKSMSNRSLAVFENGGGSVGEELTRRAANTAQSMLGDILAQAKLSFSRQLALKVQSNLVSATGAQNRGVQTDAFYVIRNPTTPAILVEIGFGSHPVEGPKLASADYREQIAQGLARAILSFLNTK